ncbi:putative zinc-binding dehydrogenase family oxidoreductase [Hypoxylon sp. NC1633]|nr:putative zinc-binding dehydrogenase family oxidoreductase [Hypoxylon sp. NC1633]
MSSSREDIPEFRQAITQDEEGRPQLATIPVPELVPGTILIKPTVVALNPSDCKMGAAFPTPGAVVGCDFAGTVVGIAHDTATDLVLGDPVYGVSNGSDPGNPENGAFATYLRAPAEWVMRLTSGNDATTLERAATLGTALATCTLSFWGTETLNLAGTPEKPTQTPLPVLVYGGSTATGTIAIQLLRQSGLNPIATCSPRNFDLVRASGASAVFDYADPNTAMAIKKHTGDRLKHVLDCISDPRSVDVCYAAMARVGGWYTSLELVPDELLARRRAVKPSFVMAYELSGQGIRLPGLYGKPADPAKLKLGEHFFPMYERMFNGGKLRTHPTQRLKDGLEGVLEGLALLKSGSMSGKKLVVFLE